MLLAKRNYEKKIIAVLQDVYRCGTPAEFSSGQITEIVALACEVLDASNAAVSCRTQEEIASEAVRRGIVKKISQQSVSRILKKHGIKAA